MAIKWPKFLTRYIRGGDRRTRSRKDRTRELQTDPGLLEDENDTFDAVLLTLETAIVGCGLRPVPRVRTSIGINDRDLEARLADLYADWARMATLDGMPEAEAQALALRRFLVDGEVFNVHAGMGQYQIFTRADVPRIDAGAASAQRGGIADDGIERDDYGRPMAYWFQPAGVGERVRVPADRVAHLMNRSHPLQRRGHSPLRSVARRVLDLDDYDRSERAAAKVASHAAFFVKRGAEGGYADAEEGGGDAEPIDLQEGTLYDDLAPGDELGAVSVDRPNSELTRFRAAQLRAIAAASGADYHALSRDFSGTYSSARQAMLESHRVYERTFTRFVDCLERAKWRWLVDWWLASGVLSIGPMVRPESLYAPKWELPRLPWIDPMKESKALDTQINNRTLSRRTAMRLSGRDPDIELNQIDAEPPAPGEPNPTPTPPTGVTA